VTTAKIWGQVVQSGPYKSFISGYLARISRRRLACGSYRMYSGWGGGRGDNGLRVRVDTAWSLACVCWGIRSWRPLSLPTLCPQLSRSPLSSPPLPPVPDSCSRLISILLSHSSLSVSSSIPPRPPLPPWETFMQGTEPLEHRTKKQTRRRGFARGQNQSRAAPWESTAAAGGESDDVVTGCLGARGRGAHLILAPVEVAGLLGLEPPAAHFSKCVGDVDKVKK
jgi:hypothetical protein